MGNYMNTLDDRVRVVDPAHYKREQYQSFMTGPEWRNVEMVEEYAAFLREGRSMFQFPYFSQMAELWRVMYQSYRAARRYNSAFQIIFSEYMLMDLFVCVFTTLELLPKGLFSFFIYPFTPRENHSRMQTHLADFYQEYAQGLQTIPFFDHDYRTYRQNLSAQYHACTDRTWLDWWSWSVLSVELFARQWLSVPLRYFMHQDNAEGATTDVLVKFRAHGARDASHARELFLSHVNSVARVSLVDENLYVKENDPTKDYISVYARLRTPRYKAFKEVVPELAAQGILLRKIAGQDHVQVKCVVSKASQHAVNATCDQLNYIPEIRQLYTYQDRIHANHKVCLFDVPVKNLHEKLEAIEQAAPVEFIHNF